MILASKEALMDALGLKHIARSGWLRHDIPTPESVAAHSWGMAFIASQLCPENLNRERVLEMCIIHDLAEVRVGDITPYDDITPSEKKALEFEALESMEMNQKSRDLFIEYESQNTPESRFVRFLDKLDMALQAEIYEGAEILRDDLDLSEFKQSAIKLAREYGFEW